MPDITDQIVDFYNALFESIFFTPFVTRLTERRRRDAVRFQILEAAGAASQSLERLFANQQLTADDVRCILGALEYITTHLSLEQIANPNTPPERIVEDLLKLPSRSGSVKQVVQAKQEAVYRIAL